MCFILCSVVISKLWDTEYRFLGKLFYYMLTLGIIRHLFSTLRILKVVGTKKIAFASQCKTEIIKQHVHYVHNLHEFILHIKLFLEDSNLVYCIPIDLFNSIANVYGDKTFFTIHSFEQTFYKSYNRLYHRICEIWTSISKYFDKKI